jgi:membrane protein YqaA with SNARE-associated domain
MDALLPDARPAAPAGASAPTDARPLPGTRAWFVFFVLWMAGWAGLALLFFPRAEQGDGLAVRIWLLALMCFYLSLCNVFLPLPTAWIVFLAALPEYALVQTPWLRVPLTAALLSSATVVANLNEYHLLAFVLRRGLGERIRRARAYGWASRWFVRGPFELLALVAFIPIPVDAVRWLAILERYSRVRFALAYFAGRGLRYVLLAACSLVFAFTPMKIFWIQVALVAAALGGRGIAAAVRRARAGKGT